MTHRRWALAASAALLLAPLANAADWVLPSPASPGVEARALRAEVVASDEGKSQATVTLTLLSTSPTPSTARLLVGNLEAPRATLGGAALSVGADGSLALPMEASEALVVEITGAVPLEPASWLSEGDAGWYGRSRGAVLQPAWRLALRHAERSGFAAAPLDVEIRVGDLPLTALFATPGARLGRGVASWSSLQLGSGRLVLAWPMLGAGSFFPRSVSETDEVIVDWQARTVAAGDVAELAREMEAAATVEDDAPAARSAARRMADHARSLEQREVAARPPAPVAPAVPAEADAEAEREAAQREAAQREAVQREAALREAAQREAEQREAAQREAAQRQAAQREAAQREAAQREAAQREAASLTEAQEREAAIREAREQLAEQRQARPQPEPQPPAAEPERQAERAAAQRDAEHAERQQREAESRATEQRDAQQRAALARQQQEQDAARLEAERREAEQREAESRAAEQREAEAREAQRRLERERAVIERPAAPAEVPWIHDAAQARLFLAGERAAGLRPERIEEAIAIIRARLGDPFDDEPHWRDRFLAEDWYAPREPDALLAPAPEVSAALTLLRLALES